MVVVDDLVITALVVIPVVVGGIVEGSHLLLASRTNVVDSGELEDLLALVLR